MDEALVSIQGPQRIRSGPGSQFCLGREPTGAVTFIVPGVPASNEAFQLVSGRLHPVRHQRVAGGIRVTLDDNHALSPVVLTQDPLVIHQLSKQKLTLIQLLNLLEFLDLKLIFKEIFEKTIILELFMKNILTKMVNL